MTAERAKFVIDKVAVVMAKSDDAVDRAYLLEAIAGLRAYCDVLDAIEMLRPKNQGRSDR